jgi:riboflavin synthase
MFTGLVDHCGVVQARTESTSQLRLQISSQFTDLSLGESIAMDGVCLTVTEIMGSLYHVDVSPETRRLTTAAQWQIGQAINLERALRASDRLGGHFVLGHVDQTAELIERRVHAEYLALCFGGIQMQHLPLFTQKGCIAINGVSLTINEVTADGMGVMLVPHTLQRTNLATLQVGDSVNVEFDTLNRSVVRYLQQRGQA